LEGGKEKAGMAGRGGEKGGDTEEREVAAGMVDMRGRRKTWRYSWILEGRGFPGGEKGETEG
jgi:hypothetical protein